MPKTGQKTLTFPLAGVDRQGGYRRQVRPYAAPWAVNVRGFDPLEGRERGGSRPGLEKICITDLGDIAAMVPLSYLDADGDRQSDIIVIGDGAFYRVRGSAATETTGELTTDAGVTITTEDGTEIVFDATVAATAAVGDTGAYSAAARGGDLYLADSVLRVYDPITGTVAAVTATEGAVPTSQPFVCVYRDRIVLAGKNHLWYASRQSDPGDWDFGADMGDVGRAVAGQLAFSGGVGQDVTAIIPIEDRALVFACSNELWVLQGDPATGRLEQVSSEIGVIAPQAWAVSPGGTLAFLSNDGVFVWTAGSSSHPVRFSEERMPEQLRNVSASTNTITMAYDPAGRGFHLFITPSTGDGSHWWLDVENKAIWPVVFQAGHQPTAVARVASSSLAEIALGGRDGIIRKFDRTATDDDGTALESHILLGPIRVTSNDTLDAMVAELHGIMAGSSSNVTWRIVMGSSAETAADAAVAGVLAAVAGTTVSGVAASGTWTAGRNRAARPRARGPWAVIWIEGAGRWAYEAVAVVSRQLGRMRT